MPTVRDNKHAPPLKERHRPARRAAFNALDRELPPEVHPEVARFFGLLSGALHKHRPAGVVAAIAYTPVSWTMQPTEVTLYTFTEGGRWAEHTFAVLEPMADAVAGMMAETEIVPVIDPVLPDVWQRAAKKRTGTFRHIGARGVLVYDAQRSTQPANGEAA